MIYDMITVGDIKLDTFVVLDTASVQCQLKMPDCQLCLDYGKKIPVDIVDSQIAGSAPNVAVGLSRLNYKTGVVGIMGADNTHKLALEVLKNEHVDTKFIKSIKTTTSSFSVVLTFKGEKTILASHTRHTYKLPKSAKTTWLYMSELGEGYEQMFKETAKYVKHNKVTLGFNPGPVQIKESKCELFDLIRQTTILFVNLEEAQAIVGENTSEIHRLATSLYKLGPKYVVITNGKEGAYAFDGKEANFCPVFPTKVIESTGAGDAFATGFMGAMMHGETHDQALKWGAINSASVVSFVGPQKGLLKMNQILHRLKDHPKFKTRKI